MQYHCKNCGKIFAFSLGKEKATCLFCQHRQDVPQKVSENGVILSYRYQIIREIGKGGHGVVCLARDILEEKNYVIKIFFKEGINAELVKPFLQEAQMARQFIHPNIVRTLGGNVDGDALYIIQSWVCGVDLLKYEREIGRITTRQACYIMAKIADALDFIWQNFSIIHRDIKPENILLDTEGNVFLTDFGIMAPSSDLDEEDDLHCTPDYVCPEALTNEVPLDIRSDIYSLGLSFFRLIARRAAFKGGSVQDVVAKRLEEDVPVLKTYCNVSQSFSAMIEKMMARYPKDRHQSIAELKRDISSCVEELESRVLRKV